MSWKFWSGAVAACALSGHAWASGFALNEQSAAGVSTALAGSGVENSPAVQFTNPAGLAFLEGTQIMGGGSLYFTHAQFQNRGTTNLLGLPTRGADDTTDPAIYSPNFYVSTRIDDRWALGLGVYAPFGLTTSFSENSVLRYHAARSDVKTIDISPSVAYRINDQLSVGVGVMARWIRSEFTSQIDTGSIGAASRIPFAVPQGSDSHVRIVGSDWGVGYKLGVTWKPFSTTAIGVGFRSRVNEKLTGSADFGLTPLGQLISNVTGLFQDSDVRAEITLPETLSVSLSQQIPGSKFTVLADVAYTHWSSFQELRIQYANPRQPDSVTNENWKDSYRVSLGGEYAFEPGLKLRAGVAYDNSPVSDATRTPRVPDNDRVWIALGVGYDLSQNTTLDVGYTHLFFSDSTVNYRDPSAGVLRGKFTDERADIVSFDLAYKF